MVHDSRRLRLLPRTVLPPVESLQLRQTLGGHCWCWSEAGRRHQRYHFAHALGPRRWHGPLPKGPDLDPKGRTGILRRVRLAGAEHTWRHIDPDDVLAAVKLNLQGRVGLVNGDAQEIMPGISRYTGGKHTYASQFVRVNTAAGTVVLASDNMYLYEDLEKHVPIAATLDAESNLRAEIAPGIVRIQ